MIIPDTSIWIEFLKQHESVTSKFTSLLKNRQIAVIEPIFAELLYGIRRPRDKGLVLSYWEVLPKLEFESGAMLKASQFANDQNFHKLEIGLMDAAIMHPAISHGHQLWTLDKKVLGVLEASNRYE